MTDYKLTAEPILSNVLLTHIPNNYIFSGSISELTKTENDKDVYLLIVNQENRHSSDVRYLTDIASISIKHFRENYNIKDTKGFYYKYNNDLCKLTILECNDTMIKYEFKLKLI